MISEAAFSVIAERLASVHSWKKLVIVLPISSLEVAPEARTEGLRECQRVL
jgi:hypothetical protein